MKRTRTPKGDLLGPRSARTARTSRPALPDNNPAILAIWNMIALIPPGHVSTYGGVARAAGYPGRARLTAYALRTASPQMHLPWYRVLGAGGRIVFPSNTRQHKEQARLLRSEGVPVTDGRVPRDLIVDEPA